MDPMGFVLDDRDGQELRQNTRLAASNFSDILSRLAHISLGFSIVLAPFRLRWVLIQQTVEPIYRDYTDLIFFSFDAFLLLTILFWVGSLILQPRPIPPGPFILTMPLLGLCLVSALGIPFSVNPLLSSYHLIRMILLFGLYLFIINEITSLNQILIPLSGSVFIQASLGLLQVLNQRSVGLQFLGEYELDPSWSGVSIVWAEGVRSLRAYGLSDHPNILGGLLSFGLVLMLCSYISREDERPHWFIVGTLFISGVIGLFVTYSRSAWVGFLIASLWIIWMLWRLKKKTELTRVFSLALASAFLLTPLFLHNLPLLGVRLNGNGSFQSVPTENRSIVEREALNRAANQIFSENALIGVGLGTFPLALKSVQPEFPYHYQPPHVVLLEAAAETGIFGALFYFVLMFIPWLAMWVNRKRLIFSPALLGASGALLAISIVGFFDYYPWLLAAGRYWQWLIWGLWAKFFIMALRSPELG